MRGVMPPLLQCLHDLITKHNRLRGVVLG